MDGAKFDRLARALAKILNRRRLAALIGGLFGMLGQWVARGSQLGPATCGEQGAVCTLLSGCCDGLICATSAINTSYGICVPGDGGMVSTGTALISPFSETAVDEITALIQSGSTAPMADPQADREEHIAEIRARKDAKRTEQRTRLATNRSARQLRKEERKEERTAEPTAEPKSGRKAKRHLRPQLKVELQFKQADGDSEAAGDGPVPIEVVRATNHGDVDVVLTRIETIQGSVDRAELTTPQFTLGARESYSFFSGLPTEDAADSHNGEYRWLSRVICGDTDTGQGYRLNAAFSRDARNHAFTVYCDGPLVAGVVETPSKRSRHKRSDPQQTKKKR